jgi:hypothetical protein
MTRRNQPLGATGLELWQFSPEHAHVAGGVDADSHRVPLNFENRDDDVVPDKDLFAALPRQN